MTDVTLATEERSFQAHKMLLSACSPYFRQLFLNNPGSRPTVFLKDVPERHMGLLLEYMYQGSIAVKIRTTEPNGLLMYNAGYGGGDSVCSVL